MNKTSKRSTFPTKCRYWRTARILQEESEWVRITENREHGSRWEKDTGKRTEKTEASRISQEKLSMEKPTDYCLERKEAVLWSSLDKTRASMCVFVCVQSLLNQQFWHCRTQWSVTAEKRQHKTRAAEEESERGWKGRAGSSGWENAPLQFPHHTNLQYCWKKDSYLNEQYLSTDWGAVYTTLFSTKN